jgi:hypothetical protein
MIETEAGVNMIRPSGLADSIVEETISGYLYKKTRDGRWQRRWFETNGVYLTYYKSRKMDKLLAALSLPQVGEIKEIPASMDPEGKEGSFALELNSRVYTLRAKNSEEAQTWVTTLTKLRDQGNTPLTRSFHISGPGQGSELGQFSPSFHVNRDSTTPTLTSADPRFSSQETRGKASATWIKNGKFCCGFC